MSKAQNTQATQLDLTPLVSLDGQWPRVKAAARKAILMDDNIFFEIPKDNLRLVEFKENEVSTDKDLFNTGLLTIMVNGEIKENINVPHVWNIPASGVLTSEMRAGFVYSPELQAFATISYGKIIMLPVINNEVMDVDGNVIMNIADFVATGKTFKELLGDKPKTAKAVKAVKTDKPTVETKPEDPKVDAGEDKVHDLISEADKRQPRNFSDLPHYDVVLMSKVIGPIGHKFATDSYSFRKLPFDKLIIGIDIEGELHMLTDLPHIQMVRKAPFGIEETSALITKPEDINIIKQYLTANFTTLKENQLSVFDTYGGVSIITDGDVFILTTAKLGSYLNKQREDAMFRANTPSHAPGLTGSFTQTPNSQPRHTTPIGFGDVAHKLHLPTELTTLSEKTFVGSQPVYYTTDKLFAISENRHIYMVDSNFGPGVGLEPHEILHRTTLKELPVFFTDGTFPNNIVAIANNIVYMYDTKSHLVHVATLEAFNDLKRHLDIDLLALASSNTNQMFQNPRQFKMQEALDTWANRGIDIDAAIPDDLFTGPGIMSYQVLTPVTIDVNLGQVHYNQGVFSVAMVPGVTLTHSNLNELKNLPITISKANVALVKDSKVYLYDLVNRAVAVFYINTINGGLSSILAPLGMVNTNQKPWNPQQGGSLGIPGVANPMSFWNSSPSWGTGYELAEHQRKLDAYFANQPAVEVEVDVDEVIKLISNADLTNSEIGKIMAVLITKL